MKLSEAIIHAMNDIDESLLEGSETLKKKRFPFLIPSLALTMVAIFAIVVVLPMLSKNESGVAMEESAEYAKDEAATETIESYEAEDGGNLFAPEVVYTEELENALAQNQDGYTITIQVSYQTGAVLSDEDLENEVQRLQQIGYEIHLNQDYKLETTLSKEEIQSFKQNGEYIYLLDIKS